MQIRTLLIFSFSLPFLVLSQETDFQQHLRTIRSAHPSDSAFIEFVIRDVLEESQDVMFVSNRTLLNGVCVTYCGRNLLKMKDTLKDGRNIQLGLKTSPFDTLVHEYKYAPGADSVLERIDSQVAYGALEGLPKQEIDTLWIKLEGKSILVPKEAYTNLFDPNLCDNELFHRSVMLYPSPGGEYLYLYIYGGEGSNTYMAKLIFDQERFLKKIVTEYADLVNYDAYRWEFIGY